MIVRKYVNEDVVKEALNRLHKIKNIINRPEQVSHHVDEVIKVLKGDPDPIYYKIKGSDLARVKEFMRNIMGPGTSRSYDSYLRQYGYDDVNKLLRNLEELNLQKELEAL